MIQLWTLGVLELRADGSEVRAVLTQPKRLALLAYLALHQPQGFVSRERVLALFWPEQDDAQARAALNRALYHLRRSLGAGTIVSRGAEEIGLARNEFWCDAIAFRSAASHGRNAEAVELYRGDLLAGFYVSDPNGFEHWLEPERLALRRLAHDCGWSLAEKEERAGNLSAAAQHAGWAAEREPYDEASLQRRLLLLDRIGDRAGAVHAYEQFARRLADDLELEPAPETRALADNIRSRAQIGTNVHLSTYANGTASAAPPPAEQHADGPKVPPPVQVSPRVVAVSAIGAVFVLVLAATAMLLRAPPQVNRDPNLVFISDIQNHTGDLSFDAATRSATNWITRKVSDAVEARPQVANISSGRVLTADTALSGAPRRAQEARAGVRIAGELYRERGTLRFYVRVIDAAHGQKSWAIPAISVQADSTEPAVQELAERASAAVIVLLDPELAAWLPVATAPPTYDALLQFMRAERKPLYWQAGPDYERAAQLDTTFTLALLQAARSELALDPVRSRGITANLDGKRHQLSALQNLMLNWIIALQENDRSAAYEALAGAAALAPTRFLSTYAMSANHLYRPRETLRLLDRADQLLPNSAHKLSATWVRRTYLHHELGEYGKEAALALHARSARPQRLDGLYVQVRALAALGRIETVKALIDTSLSFPHEPRYTPGNVMQIAAEELRAHGYPKEALDIARRAVEWYESSPATEAVPEDHVYNLAGMLYAAERWTEARALTLALVAQPSTQRAWLYGRLGAIAVRLNDRAAAQRYLAMLNGLPVSEGPEDDVMLSRARITALLGDAEGAVTLLRQAFGPQGTDLHTDFDFEALKANRAFRELIRPKG